LTAATEKQRLALVKLGVAAPAILTKSEASEVIGRAIEDARDDCNRSRLSLATLQACDPAGGRGTSRGRRYLCPFEACRGRQNERKHRSLCIATSGEYLCHRCGAKGLLADSVRAERLGAMDPPRSSRAARDRGATSAFLGRREVPTPPKDPPSAEGAAKLKGMLAECVSLIGTKGARYLEGRGIPAEVAHSSGVLFAPTWYGVGPAVVFLARDERGRVTGAQGRFIDAGAKAKALNVGAFAAEGGLFATSGAGNAKTIAIVEAPIDALSILAATGVHGVALFGTSLPACLRRRCAFKLVLVATDADVEGQACASRLRTALRLCDRVRRVVWPEGVKDANELIVRDREALRAVIAPLLPPGVTDELKAATRLGIVASVEDDPASPVAESLLDYTSEKLGWHEDWPEARPSNWDELAPFGEHAEQEPVLDIPVGEFGSLGVLGHRWVGYGYCSECKMRIEARTEDEARTLFRAHVDGGHVPAPLKATLVPAKRPTLTKAGVENLNACGGCCKQFTATTAKASADMLRQHIENDPCEHYCTPQ
jgi:hypothetical protein